MDAKTKLYCILGNPVSHSMSPAIHNAAFAEIGYNGAYVAFEVTDVEGAVRGIRALGVMGASVTIPHKVAVMPYLDRIDDVAKMIGAVNTIVREGDKLVGYNTDGPGAAKALLDAGVSLNGARVVVIGSGGAARAVAFALCAREKIGSMAVLGVVEPELKKLVADLKQNTGAAVEGYNLDDARLEAELKKANVVANASPVGMHPDEGKSPVPERLLSKELSVFDVVYNPLETKLIRDARANGCRVALGVDMFVNQGILQFEAWTGKPAPAELMRKIVLERLQGK